MATVDVRKLIRELEAGDHEFSLDRWIKILWETFTLYRDTGLPQPTIALPGTPAKVEVLESRCERRQSLFHPNDLDQVDVDHANRRVFGHHGRYVACEILPLTPRREVA